MTGREYLEELRRLDEAAMAASAQIESMEADVQRTTVRLSPAPGGGNADPAAGILALMQAKQQCAQTIGKYNQHKARCVQIIGLVDVKYRRALTLVYINYLSKAAAAEAIGCSLTWLYTLLDKGIEEFEKFM